VIRVEAVTKVFPTSRGPLPVLRDVDLHVAAGEFVGLVGPSGSGKSTLLHLITGIDRPTHGRVLVAGQELARLNEDQLARWRGRHLGIVFQFFQLLPTLTALENVILPMEFSRRGGDRRRRALDLLDRVGLLRLADHLPAELSGGEQQRVAIARALANDPPLLVADEPTGNLDSATGQEVIELFRTLCDGQRTLVLVTHDPALAQVAGRVVRLHDGRVMSDMAWQPSPIHA
jgi:putative ABC transport system ATP-binding protein